MGKYLIEAKGLKTWFPVKGGLFGGVTQYVKAVDGVDFKVEAGEVVSLVGESGSGKSTLGYTLMGLMRPTEGEIWFDGQKLDTASMKSWDSYRKDFQIIFQDSHSSLNPKQTVFEIISAPLRRHRICSNADMKKYIAEVLKTVGLDPEYMHRYPHAFSGGQRQRISIARALALKPRLIVCDEVVSALDVTIQAQILALLMKLKKDFNLALLFISHDMAVVKQMSDRVCVMYRGTLVEEGTTEQIFNDPRHVYTQTLLAAVPTFDPKARKSQKKPVEIL